MLRMTRNASSVFAILLAVILAISFSIQTQVFQLWEHPRFGSWLIESYVFNFGYAIASFITLLIFHQRKPQQLGFIYLVISMLKLIIFMVAFLPLIKKDGTIDHFEFCSFFIPYVICLTLETIYLVRLLNKTG